MNTHLHESPVLNLESTATAPAGCIKQSPPDHLLTKPQIASRLQVSTRTIDSWMALGYIPFFRIGRCVRFRWDDVLARFRE